MKVKSLFILCISVLLIALNSCDKEVIQKEKPSKEELDQRFKAQWDKPEYQISYTANEENYLSPDEKEVFYYLNIARINPSLFAETYVTDYNGGIGRKNGFEFDKRKASLIKELKKTASLKLLYPDKDLFQLALCFASQSGKLGLMGHDRTQTTCSSGFEAECCSYGKLNSMEIVIELLIDPGENNAQLGHRKILLTNYTRLGISIQPHKDHQFNSVLDFKN